MSLRLKHVPGKVATACQKHKGCFLFFGFLFLGSVAGRGLRRRTQHTILSTFLVQSCWSINGYSKGLKGRERQADKSLLSLGKKKRGKKPLFRRYKDEKIETEKSSEVKGMVDMKCYLEYCIPILRKLTIVCCEIIALWGYERLRKRERDREREKLLC